MKIVVKDYSGRAIPGAVLWIFEDDPERLSDKTYCDEACTVRACNPLIADSNGNFAHVFFSRRPD